MNCSAPADCHGRVFSSTRRVGHGSYSVIRDDDNATMHDSSFVLDAHYFCGVPDDWDETWGGYTAYVARDEKEEVRKPALSKTCESRVIVDFLLNSAVGII